MDGDAAGLQQRIHSSHSAQCSRVQQCKLLHSLECSQCRPPLLSA